MSRTVGASLLVMSMTRPSRTVTTRGKAKPGIFTRPRSRPPPGKVSSDMLVPLKRGYLTRRVATCPASADIRASNFCRRILQGFGSGQRHNRNRIPRHGGRAVSKERPMRFLAVLIPLTLATALSTPVFAAGSMQITGHGEIMATPDTAFVTSGVTSQGATAKEALDANNADMKALIDTLKAAGIDSLDIQTSGFSVSPNYVYSDARDANG